MTDCYAGYEAHIAGAKQKCQSHLARTARDWQKLTEDGSADFAYFEAIREFVRKGCRFHRLRQQGKLTEAQQETEKVWLRERLLQLIAFPVSHEKAVTLQKRILKHQLEWLVFLDDPRVPPTNNEAERALRPLVVLRKITFGHRSDAGAVRMARLMTVAETAKRHGHRPSDIYYRLFTRSPGQVLQRLYDDEPNLQIALCQSSIHGHQVTSERRLRGLCLLENFRPFAPRSNIDRPHQSPAHRLNDRSYHPNWLHNLQLSASLQGFHRTTENPVESGKLNVTSETVYPDQEVFRMLSRSLLASLV